MLFNWLRSQLLCLNQGGGQWGGYRLRRCLSRCFACLHCCLLLLVILAYGLGYLSLVGSKLFSRETVHELDEGYVTPAHNVVPDAVIHIASRAVDQAKVREIGAVVALMRILTDRLPILHQFHRWIAFWHRSFLLHRKSSLHFRLHESSLAQFEIGVLVKLGLKDGASRCIHPDNV